MSSFFDELPELEFEPELLLLPPLGLLSDFPSSFLEDELLLFPELSESGMEAYITNQINETEEPVLC